MTVHLKKTLLLHHAFLKLRLLHAALVDSFECHGRGNRMPVNRLLFILRGSKKKSVLRDSGSGLEFLLRPGFLYFIPCNHVVDLDIFPDLVFSSLQFNLDLFYGFDVFEPHAGCEVLEDFPLVEEVRSLLEREASVKSLYRIDEMIFHLCGLWTQSDEADMQGRLAKAHKYEKVLEYVRQSGDATTTVEKLATMNGMRKDVFSRKFTRDMGLPPKDFVADILIRKASELLLLPDSLVKEVAGKLNFSSEYYFSHFFKRHTGMSPRAYRKDNGVG